MYVYNHIQLMVKNEFATEMFPISSKNLLVHKSKRLDLG